MRKLILLSLMLLVNIAIYCQIEATTNDGKKVILYSDSTWKYAEIPKTLAKPPSNCSSYITTVTDKVTGETYTGVIKPLLISYDGNKSGFAIRISKSKENEIILSITAIEKGSKCIDEGDEINILFKDGTRLKLNNQKNFNCDGEAFVFLGELFGKMDELEQLKTKKIDVMRVWKGESYVERNFTDLQATIFMKSISCLSYN